MTIVTYDHWSFVCLNSIFGLEIKQYLVTRFCDDSLFIQTMAYYLSCMPAGKSDLQALKLFSCSTQLSMKFNLLINIRMPTSFNIYLHEDFPKPC